MSDISNDSINKVLPLCFETLYVAYSGGIDSHVLLHMCASITGIRHKIVAVHIHHGLQQSADDWGEHCRGQCADLAVPFTLIKVNARPRIGESPEAAARNARYESFKNLLKAGDILLLAQHREDQLETLLLQLFRGGGVHGLAGMPASLNLGQGVALRPFLDIAKNEIVRYAMNHSLAWIEDPSNLSNDFDRNYLRNNIIPLLKERWPGLDKTVSRSAKHCGNAGQLLDSWAEQNLHSIMRPSDYCLSIEHLRQYDESHRNWLLRFWLGKFGLKPPSQAVLDSIVRQFLQSHEDANPRLSIQSHIIRKYRQSLYCIPEFYFRKGLAMQIWEPEVTEMRLGNGYKLIRSISSAGIKKELCQSRNVAVKYRSGGEKITLPGRMGRRCLKNLYQEAAVPPWERDMRPLIFIDDRLAAVAGLWVDEWAWGQEQENCFTIFWQP